MTPGSALACLDVITDQTIEAACEAAVFADPQTVASAIAFTDDRFSLLTDAANWHRLSSTRTPFSNGCFAASRATGLVS